LEGALVADFLGRGKCDFSGVFWEKWGVAGGFWWFVVGIKCGKCGLRTALFSDWKTCHCFAIFLWKTLGVQLVLRGGAGVERLGCRMPEASSLRHRAFCVPRLLHVEVDCNGVLHCTAAGRDRDAVVCRNVFHSGAAAGQTDRACHRSSGQQQYGEVPAHPLP